MEEIIRNNIAVWINEIEAAVLKTADENGWTISSRGMARNTPSRYLTLRRNGEVVKVRISDHKSVYHTEHFSLSPNGYDNSLSDVIKRLEAQKYEP